jgi:4-alpha-glucanotransferase
VLYTGTHDNDTLRGWYETLPPPRRAAVRAAGVGGRQPWWELIELAQRSAPRLCMLQVQDVLGLGNEARMNLPGTTSGNWRFRLEEGQLTKRHAARLRAITKGAGRV